MGQNILLGVDTSKASFEIYGVEDGKKPWSKSVDRHNVLRFFANYPKATIVLEACGGSHYWGRELAKPNGHVVKLIAPNKVRPFRQSNKNDRNDARACVLASMSPGVNFVPIKDIWQQDILSLHRIRERHIKNQTALVNEMRGLLLEYGVTIPVGINNVRSLVPQIIGDEANRLSSMLRSAIADLHAELLTVTDNIERIDKQLNGIYRSNDVCKRLAQVEGVGALTATAIYASCPDPSLFKNGRQFAAWLGLIPGHTQTGGRDSKPIMLGITKRGDGYLRKLLVQGAMSVAKTAKKAKAEPTPKTIEPSAPKPQSQAGSPPTRTRKKLKVAQTKRKSASRMAWLGGLIEEKGMQKAAVAMANRNARVLWAMLKTGASYNPTMGVRHAKS